MTNGTKQKALTANKTALDFSKLFGQEKQAPKTPIDAFKEGDTIKPSSETQNAPTGLIGGLDGLPAFQLEKRAKKEHGEREEALRICKEHRENEKKSSMLQSEILKGLKAGADIYSLFLKAAKAISLMTGESLFYTQAEKDLIAIYGAGLQEKPPLTVELGQVEERLRRLTEALGREAEPDAQERIKRAVTAHEARAKELRRMIEKAG